MLYYQSINRLKNPKCIHIIQHGQNYNYAENLL